MAEDVYYQGGRKVSARKANNIAQTDFLGLSGGSWSPVTYDEGGYQVSGRPGGTIMRMRDQVRRAGVLGQQAGNFETPSMQGAAIDRTQGDQTRGQQQALISALQARAAGTTPSAAEMQLMRGLEAQNALAMGQAASQYGTSPGLAMQMALSAQGRNSQAANAQAAQLRAQEQATAETALRDALSGVREQDQSVSKAQADYGQQTADANLQAALKAQELRQGGQIGALEAGIGAQGQMITGALGAEDLGLRAYEGQQQRALEAALQNADYRNKANKSWFHKLM